MADDRSAFQYEIYLAGVGGQTPAYPLSHEDLEARARETLDAGAYGYVAGGAGSEDTMRANREAFRRWRIVPRMLVDVSDRDLSTTVLGRELGAPILLAPVGVLSIVHPEAELAVARAAASTGVPMVLSTVSSRTLEEVAEANGDGQRWFQLYWPADQDVTASLLQRAERAGYTAVVVTLDTRKLAWRPRDLARAYLPFLHAEGLANYLSDDAFNAGLPEGIDDQQQAQILHWIQVYADESTTWEDLASVRSVTDLPVVVKGIQHPEDARRAVDAGVAALVVSNHGGRQVDGAIASLDALPGVVEAVGDEVDVLFDSGVRSGADAFKAVALGARAVLIGRPYVWGLALGGEDGVRHVVRSLLAEFDLTLALAGHRSVGDLTRDALAPSLSWPRR